MKRIFIIILLAFTTIAYSTNYYVKTGGNDALAGTSDATAWASLAKVNASSFSPGDSVLFRRGDTFRGWIRFPSSGTSANRIVIDAYGTGAKPKILNSKTLSSTSDWTNHSGNIWKTTATAGAYNSTIGAYDIGNLFYDDNTDWGRKEAALVNCDAQGDFYYNPTDQLVYVYSSDNPASVYTNIEGGGNYAQYSVWFTGRSYITVRNIEAMYAGNNCIYMDGGSNNMIIEYCDVSWVGGWWYNTGTGIRMGNGIGMWLNGGNQHDHIIRYNRIDQCYDAGISPQGTVHSTYNILMEYNIITNCHYSYETWCTDVADESLVNVDFVNNTCLNSGYSWSANHRPDLDNDSHVMIWTTSGTVTDCDIKNNIFFRSRERGMLIGFVSPLPFLLDNNLFFDIDTIAENNLTSAYHLTLSAWQTASGRDAASVYSNPLFVTQADYRLQSSSPAIDAGVDVGLTRDFDGNVVPFNGTPDIGAYEYGSYEIMPGVTQLGTGTGSNLMVDKNGRIIIIQ